MQTGHAAARAKLTLEPEEGKLFLNLDNISESTHQLASSLELIPKLHCILNDSNLTEMPMGMFNKSLANGILGMHPSRHYYN